MNSSVTHQPERLVRNGKRNMSVDVARLFAIFGVIALHVQFSTRAAEGYNIVFWPLSVSFFYTASLMYFVTTFASSPPGAILSKIGWRIVVPYLAWTVIYSGLLVGKRLLTGNDVDLVFWRVFFYGESAVHLYFLPSLVLLQTTAFALYLLLANAGKLRITGGLLLAGAAGYYAWGDWHNCFGMAPIGRVAGFVGYIGAAFWLALSVRSGQRHPYYALVGGAVVLFAIGSNAAGQLYVFLGFPLVIAIGGIGLLLLAIGTKLSRLPAWLRSLTGSSYGIYLIHVIYLELIEFGLNRLRPDGVHYDFVLKTFLIITIFILSAVSVLIIRKVPLARLLLLGEQTQPILLRTANG